jgi:hypothetical protein
MTFQELQDIVRSNLNDEGVTFWSETDLIESMEDAYADVAFLSKCIVRKVSIPFEATPYYDFALLGVQDFLCVTAIFNENTNRWIHDDLSYRDFDKVRDDWELWTGTPQYWAPVNFELNCIVPYMPEPVGNMTLYYASKAPNNFDPTDTPLLATDVQKLLEYYCTGDMLEQAEEYVKANMYFEQYFNLLIEYSDRVKNLARRDLLLLI